MDGLTQLTVAELKKVENKEILILIILYKISYKVNLFLNCVY